MNENYAARYRHAKEMHDVATMTIDKKRWLVVMEVNLHLQNCHLNHRPNMASDKPFCNWPNSDNGKEK